MNLKSEYVVALLLLGFGVGSPCYSSELLVFDNDNLIALESSGHLYGYYEAVENNKSCMFFFMGQFRSNEESVEPSVIEKIQTFGLEPDKYSYADRYRPADIAGTVTITGGEWVFQTEQEPPGCGGNVGVFHSGPFNSHQFRYNVVSRLDALTISVATKKTYLFAKRNQRLTRTKAYLTGGDVVAVLKKNQDLSYVRYTNPDYDSPVSTRVTTGWVRTSDLENPFPPSQLQEAPPAKAIRAN